MSNTFHDFDTVVRETIAGTMKKTRFSSVINLLLKKVLKLSGWSNSPIKTPKRQSPGLLVINRDGDTYLGSNVLSNKIETNKNKPKELTQDIQYLESKKIVRVKETLSDERKKKFDYEPHMADLVDLRADDADSVFPLIKRFLKLNATYHEHLEHFAKKIQISFKQKKSKNAIMPESNEALKATTNQSTKSQKPNNNQYSQNE